MLSITRKATSQPVDYERINERLGYRNRLRSAGQRVANYSKHLAPFRKRLNLCGCALKDSTVQLKVKDGSAFMAGIMACGAVWLCASCSATIRTRWTDIITKVVLRALEVNNTCLFVTRTLQHNKGSDLKTLLTDLNGCKQYVRRQGAVRDFYKRFGYIGDIRTVEMPYGWVYGWHPHMHSIEVFAFPMTADDEQELYELYYKYARRFYIEKRGYAEFSKLAGVHIERVYSADAGKYVSKLQDGSHLGLEMARGDLKQGRQGSIMPFEVLREFNDTGDMALLALWEEYAIATKGLSSVRMSGLRGLLNDEDKIKDEDLAQENNIEAVAHVYFTHAFYNVLRRADMVPKILAAYNLGGYENMVMTLQQYGFNDTSGYHKLGGCDDG